MSKNNESAFPMYTFQQASDGPGVGISEGGLTKRELFAAMAMQALCSNDSVILDALSGSTEETPIEPKIAVMAVAQADALLAELAKEPAK